MKLALAAIALALAATPADYVAAHQQSDGGFAEPGQSSDPSLTAWAVLGLSAAGREPARSPTGYLDGSPTRTANDLALRILALDALGRDTDALTDRLEGMRGPRGRIGTLVNSTIWGVIALRATGRPAGTSARYLLRAQRKSGGWSWHPRGAPDSNDTAAADPGPAGGRSSGSLAGDTQRSELPQEPAAARRRLCARPGASRRRAIDGVGDPGLRRSREAARDESVPLPRATAPGRRQLPLLQAVRRDSGVGHRRRCCPRSPESPFL